MDYRFRNSLPQETEGKESEGVGKNKRKALHCKQLE